MIKKRTTETRIGGGCALYSVKAEQAKKLSLFTLIMLFFCTVFLSCAFIMPKYANAATTPLKNEKDKYLGSLTLSNYDSTTNKVFDAGVLADLYAALTGVEGANLQTVANDLVGTHSEMYGYSKKVNLPEYKTAAQLYELNDNHNITVNLNGQEFAVSFLTTDNNGHVIATLWMTQPLKDSEDTTVTGKMGWATAAYEVDYTTSIGESYISNAYSTSLLRMKVLNAGPTDGTATAYAMGTSNANVTSLNQSVDSETRKGNLLAPFTLDNSALVGTGYANKSLIEYLVQPSQVEYTYWLDWPATSGSKANTSYPLNETLTSPLYLSTSVGKTTTKFYGGESNGSHLGYWWNAGVYNYATSTVNHYNDWGDDYIWIPSITETGHATADGFWATGSSTTGQIRFNQEGTKDTETLAGTKVSTEHVWLRTGNPTSPSNSRFLSSSGTAVYAYSAASLAVRPALHLDLTAADESKVLNKPTADNTQFVYDSMEKTYTPNGYNSNAMDITGNVQTNANESGYKVTVTPKNGLTWADGTADPVSFTFIIKKADSVVTPELAYDEMKVNALYNTMQISDLILMVDPTKNPKPTKGTFKWTCDTTQLIEEDGVYSWEFTPADEYINNYNTSKGTFTVTNVTADVLKDISVETNEDFDSAEFYTSDTYSVLRSYLTVTAVYQSGLSKTVATYGFGTAAGALNSSNLTAGENISVPICYETKSKTITIPKVTAVIVESLSLLFIQSTAKIDITNKLNDLTDMNGVSLIVTATFNNTDTKSVDNFELKLVDGTAFKVGANDFYAVYGGVESNRVTVNVSKAVYDISALKFEDKLAPYTGEAY
ncbi:MAG: hypothetical protein K2J83_00065, partial [Clostridia bacterium]|nr:hypothetical protein [Clostridia bacterium]